MDITIIAYSRCWAMNVMTIKDFVHIASILEKKIFQESRITCSIATVGGSAVKSANGSIICPDRSLERIKKTDLIVIPAIEGGGLDEKIIHEAEIARWLSDQRSRSTPILALSTGVILLGKAGILDNQIIATHWAFLARFRKLFPKCTFTSHSSFVESNHIFTAGSFVGGVDAFLYQLGKYRDDRFSNLCAAHGLITSPKHVTPILPGRRNHLDMDISRIQDWIEEHHSEAILIESVAKRFNFSNTALKRRFKKATSMSFTQYIQAVRVERSKRLLLATDMTVRDIAYSVGYENQSFFIRVFKRETSTTPTRYRNELKEMVQS
ncbi:GlxA family transcriptional regulator [Amphritea sp. HPY]|uniref:GlxA family transcriptional regulator n=1 Tax=Amphritea sp. HPY TaxID=3421652 RepID=UPI003D7CF983